MPAKDLYHDAVRNALIKEGWTITHDPFTLSVGGDDVYIDLGAERLLGAERGDEKIAVEVKTFGGSSSIRDLEIALGQYFLYRASLNRMEKERKLYLAVPERIFATLFEKLIARYVLEDGHVAALSYDPVQETITQWKTW